MFKKDEDCVSKGALLITSINVSRKNPGKASGAIYPTPQHPTTI